MKVTASTIAKDKEIKIEQICNDIISALPENSFDTEMA